jgi:carotenoid 1,2-hydratase
LYGLTIIGFVGSVFSPYYARARRNGKGYPDNHCAINVALYGKQRRWAMTERGSAHVMRDAQHFKVGPSSMTWNGGDLTIDIRERCSPLPYVLRGVVRLSARTFYNAPVQLDATGQHQWQAVAPHGRVSVQMEAPNLSWEGPAYHDMNWGDEPLESGFRNWTWARANTRSGTEVLYDVERSNGSRFSFGRCFNAGEVTARPVPQSHPLKRGFWGMSRSVNSEAPPQLMSTLEDAPFYTRNHVGLTLDGQRCEAFHESLSLDRFKQPIVQAMLPFKMPRTR